jgi:SAM-dependent methyltransferase
VSAIWHDLECGAYAADLPLWAELADEAGGPVLDLGCGTGRVALHLARQGHRVLGLDRDATLIAAFAERAGELPAEAETGDARDIDLGLEFGCVLAPMQLIQLLESGEERRRCLGGIAAHLRPGGVAALAIVEQPAVAPTAPPSLTLSFLADTARKDKVTMPLPDAREVDSWVYSSLPLESVVHDGAILVRRLRQTVSPAGELSETTDEVRLQLLDPAALEAEAAAAGLRAAGRREIPATADHVGSTVVVFGKEAG